MASGRPSPRKHPAVAAAPTAGGDTSDELLAERGDADSFIALYRRHLPAVYRYAYARLGHRQDAEDLTALVFERAWTSLRRYRATGSFRGWLFTIAQRALIDDHRRRRPGAVPVEAVADTLPDPAAGPEATTMTATDLRLALQLVAGLEPEQREILSLRLFAGLRYDEIARVVGKREPAVKMRAHRAFATLKRRYHDEQDERIDA